MKTNKIKQFFKPTKPKLVATLIVFAVSIFINLHFCTKDMCLIGIPFKFLAASLNTPNIITDFQIITLILDILIFYLISCLLIIIIKCFKVGRCKCLSDGTMLVLEK